jgi:hypothetical protein
MKAATSDDKPEWLVPPPGVTTARVCRMSGRLASEGCDDVEVVARDGNLERRSMIYTEYFARGTEPTIYCELHPTRTILAQIAGLFTGHENPAPVNANDPAVAPVSSVVPSPTATSGTRPTEIENLPPPPAKKRGFWSRVFGTHKDDDRQDKGRAGEQPKRKSGG